MADATLSYFKVGTLYMNVDILYDDVKKFGLCWNWVVKKDGK